MNPTTLLKEQLDQNAAWADVLQTILKAMNCVTGTLHQIESSDGQLHLLASTGVPESLMDKIAVIPIGKGIAGAAAERRDAVELCNLQTDTSGTARPDAKQTKVAGSLAVPILAGEILCGTVGVGMYAPHDFSEDEKTRLWEIAALLATKLTA